MRASCRFWNILQNASFVNSDSIQPRTSPPVFVIDVLLAIIATASYFFLQPSNSSGYIMVYLCTTTWPRRRSSSRSTASSALVHHLFGLVSAWASRSYCELGYGTIHRISSIRNRPLNHQHSSRFVNCYLLAAFILESSNVRYSGTNETSENI